MRLVAFLTVTPLLFCFQNLTSFRKLQKSNVNFCKHPLTRIATSHPCVVTPKKPLQPLI